MDAVNFINIIGDWYLGESPNGIVRAYVPQGDRLKYASWEMASQEETKVYWEKLRAYYKKQKLQEAEA